MSLYFAEFWRRKAEGKPRRFGSWEPLNLLTAAHPVLELGWRNQNEGEEAWRRAGKPPEPYFEYRLGFFEEVPDELAQHMDETCRLHRRGERYLSEIELVVEPTDVYAKRIEGIITGRRAPVLVEAIDGQGARRRVDLARLTRPSLEAWMGLATIDDLREAVRCGFGFKRR